MAKAFSRVSTARRAARVLLAGLVLLQGWPVAASPEPVASKDEKAAGTPVVSAIRDDRILLNVGAIDTATPEAAALRTAVGPFEGRRLHLVQFQGAIRPEWYKELQATGVEVVQYIPSSSYLVYGDAAATARAQALPAAAVRWDGPYLDRYKIQAGAQLQLRERLGLPDRDLFSIQLVRDPETNAATLKLIESRGQEPLKSQWPILKYVDLVASLPADAVAEIAGRPDVVMIDREVVPTKNDERQDLIVAGQLAGSGPAAGNYLTYLAGKGFTQGQFTASNFVVDVSDSGIDNGTTAPNHLGLHIGGNLANVGRVQYNRLEGTPNPGSTIQGCDGHGNLNSHIVAGYVDTSLVEVPANHADASGFRYGLGVAPFVKVGSSVIFDPSNFTFPSYPNLQSRAYNDNARVSTNSWGADVAGAYTADAQAYDALVRDAQPAASAFAAAGNQEMVIVFSAGNAGPGATTLGAPGTAKNVITVGAAEGVQPFGGADRCGVTDAGADSANDIIDFSSRGPTTDGRNKPDLVAPGTHISGGVFQLAASAAGAGAASPCFSASGVCGGLTQFFPTGQQFYTASSGTSHSAPAVAGGAALVRQYFVNSGLAAPSPAMTKAALVNAARYMNGVGANDTLPSPAQGRGMMNLDTLFTQISGPRILHDQVPADMFTATGQSRIITGTVASAAQPFRVTLAFTDAPGPTTGNSFVNDLDLEVTVGGNTYRGNVFTGQSSVTGGAADPRDNLESVFLPAGVSGPFSVKVIATNIAGDGVPSVGGPLDQDYALVISNAVQTFSPVIAAGAASIVAEGCTPNGALDPGETVTLSFCLQNTGTADTTNAVGTLQATGGVTSPSGPQSYGALVAGGAAACRNFTFTVGALACGANAIPTLQVQDGASNLGNVSWTFATGVAAVSFSQNFDGATAPALPAGWASVDGAGATPWTTVATTPDTAPNAAFTPDPATAADTYLVSPVIAMPVTPAAAVLTFRHSYQFEASAANPSLGFDGGVLEISIGGGAFQDVVAAGGVFQGGGYNRTISTGFGSALAGRPAWSGDSGGYQTTSVALPSVSGQNIQLRWRRATDTTVAATGWRVDTISLAGGRACCTSPTADLSITKTDGVTAATPGGSVTYTIVASNAGPSSATGATVTDTFPAALTATWTCVGAGGGTCTAAGAGNINAAVNLPVGASVTYTVAATISAAATGTLSNTATVTPPGGVGDPVPANNSATDTDTLVAASGTADLSIANTDGLAFYYPGQALGYTIIAGNAGPSAVTAASVADTLPVDLTGATWTCAASAGSACGAPSGAGNIATTVNLLSGGTATFSLTATASPTAIGSIANTATIAAPGGIIDPAPGNNSATDTDVRKGGSYHTVAPCRVLDTRDPVGPFGAPPLAASTSRSFAVAGHCGVPSNATALSINLTVTNGTAPGFVVVSPTGGSLPPVSTINYSAGQTRANNAVVALGTGGQVDLTCGQPTGTVDAILDVSGYFVE